MIKPVTEIKAGDMVKAKFMDAAQEVKYVKWLPGPLIQLRYSAFDVTVHRHSETVEVVSK